MEPDENNPGHFLELIRRGRRGKFKVYIGMSAGVGKTYRMLQEAQSLLKNGVDVKLGYVVTHGRKETEALLEGLPLIPRRKLFYKGKEIEEMDLQTIISLRPEVVVVDELAHSNVEGSKNEKRWQDVMDILNAGINVVSAVNIQHLESVNKEIKSITGVEVQERVPDLVLAQADEVVNIDLTADELIERLREGKIYAQDKIEGALQNFFKREHILQLRELALKEVAAQVLHKVETEIPHLAAYKHERILTCISTNATRTKHILRKSARLAAYYHAKLYVLYVETPGEHPQKIALDKQRHLINNLMFATELGAEIVKLKSDSIAEAIMRTAEQNKITTICIGKPRLSIWKIILSGGTFNVLLKKLASSDIDLIIVS